MPRHIRKGEQERDLPFLRSLCQDISVKESKREIFLSSDLHAKTYQKRRVKERSSFPQISMPIHIRKGEQKRDLPFLRSLCQDISVKESKRERSSFPQISMPRHIRKGEQERDLPLLRSPRQDISVKESKREIFLYSDLYAKTYQKRRARERSSFPQISMPRHIRKGEQERDLPFLRSLCQDISVKESKREIFLSSDLYAKTYQKRRARERSSFTQISMPRHISKGEQERDLPFLRSLCQDISEKESKREIFLSSDLYAKTYQ